MRISLAATLVDSVDKTETAPAYDVTVSPLPLRAQRFAMDYETVVRELYRDVWLLCRYLSDVQSADDLTQETFLRVHRALPAFRSEASVKTWVLSIARRTCADAVRERGRERRKMDRLRHAVSTGARVQLPDVADGVGLWALVDQLEPDRRAAFVLTQFFGLSYGEAATVCGCPVGTIRSRVARARGDLIDAHTDTGAHRRTGRLT